MKTQAEQPEKRRQVWRRQFNASFMDEHGHVIVAKVIAAAGQVMLLYYTASYFDRMIEKPDTLLVCLALIIMPDMVKKFLNLKYGNGAK